MDSKISVYQAFKNCAVKHPNDTALVYQFKKFTYSHVLDKINRLAYGLKKLGYKEDDIITVSLPNVPMAVYLLYAINQIGAIANLIHPLMKNKQLKEIMLKTKSKVLFALDSNIDNFRDFADLGVSLYSVSPTSELNCIAKIVYKKSNKISKLPKAESLIAKNKEEQFSTSYLKDSFYLHSGSTTGEAKTIALSNFAINSLAVSGLIITDIKDGHNCGMLAVLPMFHGFGLVMGVHISIIHDGFDVLMPKFDSKQVIKYLKRNQIQNIIGVPILYEALLRNKDFKGKKLSGIINAFVGGDFLNNLLKSRFDERMKESGARARLFEGYGLTEAVTVCTVNTHVNNRDYSVGKPIPNVTIKIVDPNTNKKLANNVSGEICVTGDTLMNGYRFEKRQLNPYLIDEDGTKWIKTGDYGMLDDDGYLYFKQRLKRIIKVSGINIFPNEIENELKKLPFIFESFIKGVNDTKHGQMVRLYVVIDRAYEMKKYDSEINNLIVEKFGIYAKPKEIIYLNKLPKTLVGKVDEKALNS